MADSYQVVDENDQIIGYKKRADIDFKRDIYRIAAIWLTNSKGEVLISQRLLSKDKDPGKWGPAAAGTLEEGETYESNAYKEAEEEIGLKDVPLSIGQKVYLDKPRRAFLQWYTGVCNWPKERFTPQPSEVETVKWVTREWLEQDVKSHPDNYVPAMAIHLKTIPA